ncbi:MAG: molybdenum cofactor guanylyltransferase [Vicinamibacteria bacterium]
MHEYITNPERQEPSADLEGAILAGGLSRRMGCDKALLHLGGRQIVDAIAEALLPLVRRVRVMGRERESRKAFAGLEIQPDLRPGLGPLSGIHSALSTARADAVLIVACDLPFVTTVFFRGLVEHLTADFDAVVPCPGNVPVAVCALYRRSCLSALEARLDRRELVAADFARSLRTRFLGDEEIGKLDPADRCLWNLNTKADYVQAQVSLRERK